MNVFPSLYKLDSKGKVREWRMEVEGNQYRTIAGLKDGNQVTSGWTTAKPKNVGRANATTAEEQAVLEVEAQYTKKLHGEYHASLGNINTSEFTTGAKFFKPMLAASWEKRINKIKFGEEQVFVQPKLDGIRNIQLPTMSQSRTGHEILAVPFLSLLFAPVFAKYPSLVFDGELYNHDLHDNFNEITAIVRKTKDISTEDLIKAAQNIQYHVYDLPSADGDTFDVRFNTLSDIVTEFADTVIEFQGMNIRFGDVIRLVPTVEADSVISVDEAYGEYLEAGYEGGIIRLNGEYQQKRSNNLIKRKDMMDAEFTISRIEEGEGNWAGVAKRVYFFLEDGREQSSGLKGSKDYAAHVLKHKDDYVGKQATIQFFGYTPDGKLRFPIAKTLHMDKRW